MSEYIYNTQAKIMIENLIGFFDDSDIYDIHGGFISNHLNDSDSITSNNLMFKKTNILLYNMISDLEIESKSDSINLSTSINSTKSSESESSTSINSTNSIDSNSESDSDSDSDSDNFTKRVCQTILNEHFSDQTLNLTNLDKLMRTMLIPLTNANTITVGVFIKSGSRQEKSAYGIAHFLEHMSFKGTHKRSSEKLMLELDSIGANYNAMTGHEFTLYYISGDPRDVNLILDIIMDLYLDPIYPESDIVKERDVVLEEFRMNEDNSHRVLTNALYSNIYGPIDSTLARPIIGYNNTIEQLNRSDIMTYRNINYIGSNCLLCVSGNFDVKNVKLQIEKKFNSKLDQQHIESNMFESNLINNPIIQPILELNPKVSKYINLSKDINQSIIYIVFNAYSTYNKMINALDLFADILSNGFSSRFFNLLRNKMGVSYYNNTFTRTFDDCGQMIINVGVDHKSIVKTIKAILNELKNIRLNGITEAELAKSKKQNETALLFQFKDPYEYMMYYGMNTLIGKPLNNLSTMLNEINNVSMTDINNVINNVINKKNIVIGTMGKVNLDAEKEIIKLIENF